MVSVEPIRTLATLPVKLSGETLERIFSRVHNAPLPDTGRMTARLTHSAGKPRKLVMGERTLVMISTAPDEENIPTAVIRSTSEGRISRTVSRLCFAPQANSWAISTPLNTPESRMKVMTAGTKISPDSIFFAPQAECKDGQAAG